MFIFWLNVYLLTVVIRTEFLENCLKIGNNIMKLYFSKLAFKNVVKFLKLKNTPSCCGQPVSLKILIFILLWSLKAIFCLFFGPRAHRSACISTKKTPLKICMQKMYCCRWLLLEIANGKSWPQQKHMISILRNLHKVKRSH